MTNNDLRNMDVGLATLRRYPTQPTLTFMVAFAINILMPAFKALDEAQQKIRAEYLDLDESGAEKYNGDGMPKLQEGKSGTEYEKKINELFLMDVDPPLPKFKFKFSDFIGSNLSLQPNTLLQLGQLVDLTGIEEYVAKQQGKGEGPPIRGPALTI